MFRYSEPPSPGAPTTVAVRGHPLHPMLVTFPIAFLLAALPSDAAFLYTGDEFWARMSIWLLGAGTVMGTLAGVAGTVELFAEKGIRRRAASWNHFVAAVMLLAISFANWEMRWFNAVEAIWPWGLYLSALQAFMVALSGWLGGHLVFEHQVGVVDHEGD